MDFVWLFFRFREALLFIFGFAFEFLRLGRVAAFSVPIGGGVIWPFIRLEDDSSLGEVVAINMKEDLKTTRGWNLKPWRLCLVGMYGGATFWLTLPDSRAMAVPRSRDAPVAKHILTQEATADSGASALERAVEQVVRAREVVEVERDARGAKAPAVTARARATTIFIIVRDDQLIDPESNRRALSSIRLMGTFIRHGFLDNKKHKNGARRYHV